MSRPLRIFATLSFSLLITLLLLWPLSHYACVRVVRGGVRRDPCLILAGGNIIYWRSGGGQAEPPFPGRVLKPGEWAFQLARVPDPPPGAFTRPNVGMPFWFAALPTVIGPLIWIDSRLAVRKRMRQSLCVRCGYDLRATPERCPECGTVKP